MRADRAELRLRLATRPRWTFPASEGFTPAAVLVPIVDDERLIFTVRRDHLPTHAGQISFPGGKRDPADESLFATALREAAEELGIAREEAEVLGLLDDVPVPSRFVISPVVAAVRPSELKPNLEEVAEVFSATFSQLRAGYRSTGTRWFQGIEYVLHEYQLEQHRIWGATARIVFQLIEQL